MMSIVTHFGTPHKYTNYKIKIVEKIKNIYIGRKNMKNV